MFSMKNNHQSCEPQKSFFGSFETVKNYLLKMLGYWPEIKFSPFSTADLPVAKMIPYRADQFNCQRLIYRERGRRVVQNADV